MDSAKGQDPPILAKLVGKRIHEVINNVNVSTYLHLDIGDELDVVDEHEYQRSIKEGRPCQPMREFLIASYCPYVMIAGDRVVWSTDDERDIDNWAFSRGARVHNLDIAPYLMGARIKSVTETSGAIRMCLDSGVDLLMYPFWEKPHDALVSEFYGPPEVGEEDYTTPDHFVIFDNRSRVNHAIFEGQWTEEQASTYTVFVDKVTGLPKPLL